MTSVISGAGPVRAKLRALRNGAKELYLIRIPVRLPVLRIFASCKPEWRINGSIFVDHNGFMITLYWSNKAQYGNNAACMESVLPGGQDGAGSYVNLDLDTVDGCTSLE